MTNEQALDRIAHSLEQITDILNGTAPLEITREHALDAWGMRIYEDEYLHALETLGLPRMCGDDPERVLGSNWSAMFAPHVRG